MYSQKAIEQLKALPNLLQQFSPLYSTCKAQTDEMITRFEEVVTKTSKDYAKNGDVLSKYKYVK